MHKFYKGIFLLSMLEVNKSEELSSDSINLVAEDCLKAYTGTILSLQVCSVVPHTNGNKLSESNSLLPINLKYKAVEIN